MNTKIKFLCIVMSFSFLTSYCQITRYKYNPVKKPTSTSKSINTMSNSYKKNYTKVAYKKPGLPDYTKHNVTIKINGENVGYSKIQPVNNNMGSTLNVNKRPVGSTTVNNNVECLKTAVSINGNSKSLGLFKPTLSDWVLPGAILESKSILDGSFKLIDEPRDGPITYSTTELTSIKSFSIPNPSEKSKLQDGVNSIKENSRVKNKKIGADLEITYKEVHSLQELGLYLTGSYSQNFVVGDFSSKISASYNKKNSSSYYMMKFKQELFTISVDDRPFKSNELFKNKDIKKEELVYISSVTYGRIAYVMVKTNKKFIQKNIDAEAKIKALTYDAKLKLGASSTNSNDNYEIEAVFYGGDADAAIADFDKMTELKKLNIQSYLRSHSSTVSLTKPISYTLKNFKGDYVGVKTVINQNVTTCIPIETKKLIVKLDAFYCVKSQDSDNKDDYAFNQWIDFKINNKPIKAVKTYRTSKFFKDFNGNSSQEKRYPNRLMSGDIKHQFWVAEGSRARIGHYVEFEFSDKDINNILKGNYSFRIINRVKEYSGGSGKDSYLAKGEEVDLDLKNVYLDLINIDNLEVKKYKSYQKGGSQLEMRKYAEGRKDIYGYINFSKNDRKARAMMRFKLKD